MVVLSCQRDRARKRDLAALGLAFLTPHSHLDRQRPPAHRGGSTVPRCACTRPMFGNSPGPRGSRPEDGVVPYDVRRGAAGSGFLAPNVPVRTGSYTPYASVRMDHYYRGAMLKDKNSSRSEAQPQGARRRASGGAEPPVRTAHRGTERTHRTRPSAGIHNTSRSHQTTARLSRAASFWIILALENTQSEGASLVKAEAT